MLVLDISGWEVLAKRRLCTTGETPSTTPYVQCVTTPPPPKVNEKQKLICPKCWVSSRLASIGSSIEGLVVFVSLSHPLLFPQVAWVALGRDWGLVANPLTPPHWTEVVVEEWATWDLGVRSCLCDPLQWTFHLAWFIHSLFVWFVGMDGMGFGGGMGRMGGMYFLYCVHWMGIV